MVYDIKSDIRLIGAGLQVEMEGGAANKQDVAFMSCCAAGGSRIPHGFDTFAVYIKMIKDGVPRGGFMNPYIKEYTNFNDLGDMIIKMDKALKKLLEEEKHLGIEHMERFHSFQESHFSQNAQKTFLIQIISTQHHSWQGFITGAGRKMTAFKSALECISKIW